MKFIVQIFFPLLILSQSACIMQSDIPSDTPNWLKNKIKQLKKESVQSPPASVFEYTYKGDRVFYFPARCCDIFSDLYDEQGSLLCHPDGGFTGGGDGQCPDFWQNSTETRLIWKDNRK